MIIKNDLFGIAKRIREIDKSYFIVFNNKDLVFELHGGKENGYILTLPFDRLDERSLTHIRRTRVERLEQLIAEIDRENEKIEISATNDAKRQARNEIEEGVDRVTYRERRRK